MARPARLTLKGRPPREHRPLALSAALMAPGPARLVIRTCMRMPQGALRRALGAWMMREVALGSILRRDERAMRVFTAPDFVLTPAAEVAQLMGHDGTPIAGVEAGMRYLWDWFDGWDEFESSPVEGVDLGDGRALLLCHLRGRSRDGLEVAEQEESELWEIRRGRVVRVSQWWSWQEGLEAIS